MALLSDRDPLETQALEAFDRAHPELVFGEIAFLIPSYREVKSIGAVLEELPKEVSGRRVTVLVILDGGDDGTAEVATQRGALITSTGGQRGQGAALRLGYRLATAHGAKVLVTLDADGQYDPADIASIVEPVLRGEADFVSGSRRLGADGTTDQVRSLGVGVFAGLISFLSGHRITDPAFGLRAMTAEVVRAVTLEQPQYQASELLLGTILRGFRATERPATLRKRKAEQSRKGRNFVYGYRFGRVVLRTWWRDRRGR